MIKQHKAMDSTFRTLEFTDSPIGRITVAMDGGHVAVRINDNTISGQIGELWLKHDDAEWLAKTILCELEDEPNDLQADAPTHQGGTAVQAAAE